MFVESQDYRIYDRFEVGQVKSHATCGGVLCFNSCASRRYQSILKIEISDQMKDS